MRLIGQRCKCGDALSWLILIGRRFIHTRTERSHNFSRKTNQVNLKLLFSFQGAISLKDLVTIPEWSHLFPSRTQKLSTPGPKIAMPAIVNRGRCRFARVLARAFLLPFGDPSPSASFGCGFLFSHFFYWLLTLNPCPGAWHLNEIWTHVKI